MTSSIVPTKYGYRKPDAADLVGLKPTKFMQLVNDGRMPQPTKIDGCVIWDGRDLAAAFDKLMGKGGGEWTI